MFTASPFQHYDIGTPTLTDIWVDPAAGNDANSGGARAQALRTLAEAWNRVPSGDTLSTTGYRIQLAPGRYTEDAMPTWWDDRHGSQQCPIILQAADGPGTVTLAGMDVHDVHYMYLIGLRLEAHGGNVLHFASCDHVLLRDSELVGIGNIVTCDSPQESLKANQSQYVYVEDSDISGAYWAAVDYVSVQYGHVIGTTIHHAGDWGMYFKGGSAYLRVEGNEIYDAVTGGFSAGQGTGFEFMATPWLHYETYDVKFVNNVVHDTEGAGIAVNGSYNVLMAHNTLYRVGRTSHVIEAVQGLRGCDGNTTQCHANLAAGGWGTATPGATERIPNRHIYIYNNIVYNPAGYQSQWQQFAIAAPVTPSGGTNIPNPSRADDDLQIRGNIIWNGPPTHPLGIEDVPGLLVTEAQLRADNAINTVEPQLIDPAHGDFRLVPGGNVVSAVTFAPPDFTWTDAPSPPTVPDGNLSNAVPNDRSGNLRVAFATPGAYAGPQTVFFLHQSVGQGIMDDHNGHPGLVSQVEALGCTFNDYSLWNSPPGGSVPTEIATLFADQNDDGQYGDLLAGISGATEANFLMLKSCFYTLADLEDPDALSRWQDAFVTSVAPYANQHPDQILVVMPAVPERKSSGLSAAAAARARDWSDWLAGDFITNYTTQDNVASFNLFDFLADPASDAHNANYQREEYLNSDGSDSHPNNTAYSAAADAIAGFLRSLLMPDETPTLSMGDVSIREGNSRTSNAVFTVTLSAPSTQAISVNYTTVDGTALADTDYTSGSGVLTFTPGQTHKSITVPVQGDRLYENNETFQVSLTDPASSTVLAQATGTIVNDDAAPTVSVSVSRVKPPEGNSDTTQATFTLTLSTASGRPTTIHYATSDGTARAGSDYEATTDTSVTIPAGQTRQTFTVPIHGDTTYEANETFRVTLSNPPDGANIARGRGTATWTIRNDDLTPPTISISNATLVTTPTGAHADFVVTLSAASGVTATVRYGTANGTAKARTDFRSTAGTLVFNPGETEKSVSVAILGDLSRKAGKAFYLNLAGARQSRLGSPSRWTFTFETEAPAAASLLDALSASQRLTSPTSARQHGLAADEVIRLLMLTSR